MSQVIQNKTDKHQFGVWPVAESVTTIITLIYTDSKTFAIDYDCTFSGVKSGHVQGGPISVFGNTTVIVNQNPEVKVTITQFNNDTSRNYISLHIKIEVNIPVIGWKTIFDETLGGDYNLNG